MTTIDERVAKGEAAQERAPLSAHAGWVPAGGRPSPVDSLEEQEVTREPDLVPVRHGRMMVSPFTFYRGAAKIMAEDLKGTGVRANSVLPSIIDTSANRKAMPKAEFAKWPKPEAIARVILFLCSPDAKVIHGASIPVYGNQ